MRPIRSIPEMDAPSNPQGSIKIEICDTQSHVLVDDNLLRAYVLNILAHESITQADISIALVDDETLLQINQRFLGHDWPTDVVTFCLSESASVVLVGELI